MLGEYSAEVFHAAETDGPVEPQKCWHTWEPPTSAQDIRHQQPAPWCPGGWWPLCTDSDYRIHTCDETLDSEVF